MLRASHRALRWLVVDASRRVTTASFSSHSDIPQLFSSFPQDRGRIFSGAPSLGPLLWPRSECSMSACTIGSRSFCTEDSVLTVSSNLILAAHSRSSQHAPRSTGTMAHDDMHVLLKITLDSSFELSPKWQWMTCMLREFVHLSSIVRDTAFTSYAVMLCVLVRRNKGGRGSPATTYSTYNG